MLISTIDYLNGLKEQSEKGEHAIDMNNPFCLNCNECCSMLTVLSPIEYEALLNYFQTEEGKAILKIAKNKVKRHWRKSIIYMMCPFTDDETKKCMIYSKRPCICKKYHCNKSTYEEYLIFKQKYFKELELESKTQYNILDFFKDVFL